MALKYLKPKRSWLAVISIGIIFAIVEEIRIARQQANQKTVVKTALLKI